MLITSSSVDVKHSGLFLAPLDKRAIPPLNIRINKGADIPPQHWCQTHRVDRLSSNLTTVVTLKFTRWAYHVY